MPNGRFNYGVKGTSSLSRSATTDEISIFAFDSKQILILRSVKTHIILTPGALTVLGELQFALHFHGIREIGGIRGIRQTAAAFKKSCCG